MKTKPIKEATARIMAAAGQARESYARYHWEEDQGYDEEKLKELAKRSTEDLTALEYLVSTELEKISEDRIMALGRAYATIEHLEARIKTLEKAHTNEN